MPVNPNVICPKHGVMEHKLEYADGDAVADYWECPICHRAWQNGNPDFKLITGGGEGG